MPLQYALRPPGIRPIDYPDPPPGVAPGPNHRQAIAHASDVDELLFGGARGGGKTDFALAEAINTCLEFPGMRAAIFRRSYPELTQASGVVERLLKRLPPSVATYKAGPPPQWTFANGSILWAAHLTSMNDVGRFLGGEYQLFIFEQAEQIDELTYRLLQGSLRVSGELARRMQEAGYRPRSILTANPGGVGTEWLRERFIDPFPAGEQEFIPAPTEDEPSPGSRVFIPSLLSDNPALELGDPSYRRRLESLPPDERAAQLYGNWYVYKGNRFRSFSAARHVVEPQDFPIPLGAGVRRALGIDYGMTNPFVGLWGALMPTPDITRVVVYREVDATDMTPAAQAKLLLASEAPGERDRGRPVPTALDPACWAPPPDKPLPRTGGERPILTGPPPGSIADTYQSNGLHVVKADNRRLEGAAKLDQLLQPQSDGLPGILIHSTCTDLIRTLPQMPRDKHRPEDVAKNDKDHWYDALRYLLALLLQMPEFTTPKPPPPPTPPPAHAAALSKLPRLGSLRTTGF